MKHFTVTRITILQREGHADLVLLHTDLPSGIKTDPDPLTLEFHTTTGAGPDYCKTTLGIEQYPGTPCPVEIIRS